MPSTLRTTEKSLRQPLRKPPLLQLRLSSLFLPRSFFPFPRPLKSLARLVTKVEGQRWPRVRRLTRPKPGQRIKAGVARAPTNSK